MINDTHANSRILIIDEKFQIPFIRKCPTGRELQKISKHHGFQAGPDIFEGLQAGFCHVGSAFTHLDV